MKTLTYQPKPDSRNGAIDAVDDVLIAFDALAPSEFSQKIKWFTKVYPGMVRQMAREVSQQDILSALNSAGLLLAPIQFREMLEPERKLRNKYGDRICFEICGSVLQIPQASELSLTRKSVNLDSQLTNRAQA